MARDTVRIEKSRYPRRTPPMPADLQSDLLAYIEAALARTNRPFGLTSHALLESWFEADPVDRTCRVAGLGISRPQLDRFVHYHLSKLLERRRRELREAAQKARRHLPVRGNALTYRIGDVVSIQKVVAK